MKLEKLETRLEMQAVFLPDGTELESELEVEVCGGEGSCNYICTNYTCVINVGG